MAVKWKYKQKEFFSLGPAVQLLDADIILVSVVLMDCVGLVIRKE